MGVDDGGDVKLFRDAAQQFVDDERCVWVQSRVWLVAEQIFGVKDDGACYGHTLLHAARDLAREFLLSVDKVYAVKTVLRTFHTLAIVH